MANVKEYSYNDRTQLTKHFKVSEFKCKCGKNHSILIADEIPTLLENLMTKIGAKTGNLSSGYRCSSHDKNVGGSGSGPHVSGLACDIRFTDYNGNNIPSKDVVLALEDMGHKYGIGYKCGGSSIYTHIDVKPRKWYGDESVSMSKSCCSSFYDYFGIKKETSITYTVVKGDYLSKIAKKYNTTWQKIYNDNKSVIGSNPNLIKVGQKLVIKK